MNPQQAIELEYISRLHWFSMSGYSGDADPVTGHADPC